MGEPTKRLSAVFVTVPAEGLVGEFRRRHQPRAVARHLPPHITVLPPFWRVLAEDQALARALTEHFAALSPFAAELARVGTFKRHVWLGPEPHERFVELLRAAGERFADLIGEDEATREPTPHLTIAEIVKGGPSKGRVAQLAREELGPQLPFRFAVEDVVLYEVLPEGWHEVRRFPLG